MSSLPYCKCFAHCLTRWPRLWMLSRVTSGSCPSANVRSTVLWSSRWPPSNMSLSSCVIDCRWDTSFPAWLTWRSCLADWSWLRYELWMMDSRWLDLRLFRREELNSFPLCLTCFCISFILFKFPIVSLRWNKFFLVVGDADCGF